MLQTEQQLKSHCDGPSLNSKISISVQECVARIRGSTGSRSNNTNKTLWWEFSGNPLDSYFFLCTECQDIEQASAVIYLTNAHVGGGKKTCWMQFKFSSWQDLYPYETAFQCVCSTKQKQRGAVSLDSTLLTY